MINRLKDHIIQHTSWCHINDFMSCWLFTTK